MKVLDEAKAIIFDLDGTLYEGDDHFKLYIKLTSEKLSHEKDKKKYAQEVQDILNGKHPMRIGTVLDKKRRNILTVDPFTFDIKKVTDWSGIQLSEEEVLDIYGSKIKYNVHQFTFIGDGWSPPVAVAAQYGLSPEIVRGVYQQVKETMVSGDYTLPITEGLKEGLWRLKRASKTLILMTNSDEADVRRLLAALGLTSCFSYLLTSAKKPFKSTTNFKQILEKYHLIPEEVVSVGDNFFNEIAPALRLGMKGVYITQKDFPYKSANLTVVKTLSNQI
ncbi:HAD family hydrolase [Terrilactibacillus laevilacticus]|uniref:HAD family hydrolase n=1 Tax=Terrilactibacillus laevilacticus TaxID=1380157 RepID=A0ABW5PQM1_9BACI|nr:HAD family hydrolase [Terrilactibacillus laevilacticus]